MSTGMLLVVAEHLEVVCTGCDQRWSVAEDDQVPHVLEVWQQLLEERSSCPRCEARLALEVDGWEPGSVMTVAEAAAALGMTGASVRNWISRGYLRVVHEGTSSRDPTLVDAVQVRRHAEARG